MAGCTTITVDLRQRPLYVPANARRKATIRKDRHCQKISIHERNERTPVVLMSILKYSNHGCHRQLYRHYEHRRQHHHHHCCCLILKNQSLVEPYLVNFVYRRCVCERIAFNSPYGGHGALHYSLFYACLRMSPYVSEYLRMSPNISVWNQEHLLPHASRR